MFGQVWPTGPTALFAAATWIGVVSIHNSASLARVFVFHRTRSEWRGVSLDRCITPNGVAAHSTLPAFMTHETASNTTNSASPGATVFGPIPDLFAGNRTEVDRTMLARRPPEGLLASFHPGHRPLPQPPQGLIFLKASVGTNVRHLAKHVGTGLGEELQ